MVNERPRRWGGIRTTRQRTYRLDPDDSPQSPTPRYGGIITEVRGNQVTETTTRRQRLTEAARQVGADTLTAGKVVGRHIGRAGRSAARSAARLSVNQLRQIDRLGLADTDEQAASLLRQGATHARRTSKSTIKGGMHAAKVVVKRFLPGVPPAPKLTKHQPGLIGRLTRKLIRGGTKKFVAAGRNGIRAGVRTAGSSLRAEGYLDADRAAFRAAQTAWQKPTRFGLKQAGRPVKWAARHAARAAMRVTVRVTMLGAKTVVAAMGAAGALLPVLIGIIGIVAALCAILPSFITGAGAENHRRQAARSTCVGGSAPGHAVTAEEVAAFLPNPNGKDISLLLTAEQRATATAIVEEGQKAGIPPRGWAVALMTAMQESTMGANPSTKKPNGDVDVGVFQQRAKVGWYADGATVEENTNILNDVRYAARTFYLGHDVAVRHGDGAGSVGYHIPGLVNVEGWQSMDLGQAAQTVQVSDFPGYYSKHEATVASLLPTLSPQGCAGAGVPGASGLAGKDDYAGWYAKLPDMVKAESHDPNGFAWRQCTSYAAFAVKTYSKYKDFNNWWRQDGGSFGNANTWHLGARKAGIRVDQTPAVGSVAQRLSGDWGHVAYVVAVHEDGSFTINEYNHITSREFSSRTARVGSGSHDFTNFLHFEE